MDKDILMRFLDNWASGGEGLPDGAHQAYMMKGVAQYNDQNGTNHDPFNSWLDWLEGDHA